MIQTMYLIFKYIFFFIFIFSYFKAHLKKISRSVRPWRTQILKIGKSETEWIIKKLHVSLTKITR